MRDLDELIAFSHELADIARPIVRADCTRQITHEMKQDGSPVTPTDKRVEQALRERIEARYPDHGVLGEEFGTLGLDREFVWVIDPIDGTRQFALGLPSFGCLLALCRDAVPVIGVIEQPLLARRWVGVSGRSTESDGTALACRTRQSLADCIMAAASPESFARGGREGLEALYGEVDWYITDGGCLTYASLAQGQIDVCLGGPNLDPFDICALAPVVEGAGGVMTDWRGDPVRLDSRGPVLAAGGRAIHDLALTYISRAVGH